MLPKLHVRKKPQRSGDVTQSVKGLACKHEERGLDHQHPHQRLGTWACMWNSSTREVETGQSLRLAYQLSNQINELQDQ